jgi:predicted Zn-dependent protease
MKIEWIEKYMADAVTMINEGGQQMHEGVNVLNDLLYHEPGYARLHNHLGWAHLYYTLNMEQAELHLNTAIKFQPDYQAPYLHLGSLFIKNGKYSEAIKILNAGVTKPEANKSEMLEMIGQAYELQQEFKLAIKAYREAMLSTVATNEVTAYAEGIKRCRKKRWTTIFN